MPRTKSRSTKSRFGKGVARDATLDPISPKRAGAPSQRLGQKVGRGAGILGYTARGVITLQGLKRRKVKQYDNKIKNIQEKKKHLSHQLEKGIYEQAQQMLEEYKQKTQQAKNLNQIYSFENINSIIGKSVNEQKQIIHNVQNRIEQVKQNIQRSKNTQDRINDRRRRSSGERRIRYSYDRRIERERQRAYEKELNHLNKTLNSTISQLNVGYEYPPAEKISGLIIDDGKSVMNHHYEYRRSRLINRERRAIARERDRQRQKELEEKQKQYQQMYEKGIDLGLISRGIHSRGSAGIWVDDQPLVKFLQKS